MTKTTKIVVISSVVLALGLVGFFVVRRLRKPKMASRKAIGNKTTTGTKTNTNIPTTGSTTNTKPSSTSTNVDKMPTKPMTIVTSSNTPVIMTSSYTPSSSTTIKSEPDLTTSTYKKLDDKLKKLYYILAPVDKKDGVVVYVEAEGFKPEYPNQPLREEMKNTLWRVAYNDYKDLVRGFNLEERNQATKDYGNQMLNVFKTLRLDYLFDPKIYNENQAWYKDAETKSIKANVKTDFWKIT